MQQSLKDKSYAVWHAGSLTILRHSVDTVENAIKRRFSHVFELRNAIVAAVTSPKYKLKGVESQEKKDSCKQMFLEEIRT